MTGAELQARCLSSEQPHEMHDSANSQMAYCIDLNGSAKQQIMLEGVRIQRVLYPLDRLGAKRPVPELFGGKVLFEVAHRELQWSEGL